MTLAVTNSCQALGIWLLAGAGAAVLADWLRQVGRLKLGILGPAGGAWPWPILGSVWRIVLCGISNIHRQSRQDFEDFGKMHAWEYFSRPMFSTNCGHHLRRVLVTHWKSYDRSAVEQEAFGELLGRGLIFADNSSWGEMRRLYQPGFSDGNILAFQGLVRAWAEEFAGELLGGDDGGVVDIQGASQALTFRVVGLFTLGIDFGEPSRLASLRRRMSGGPWPCQDYGELWLKLLEHTQDRIVFGPFQWWRLVKTPAVRAFETGLALLLEEIDDAFDARVAGQRPAHAELRPEFQDLISLMLETPKGRRFSREEVRHQALTFLFAGHDTTTGLVSWCLHLLAQHPDMLRQARREAREVDGPKPFLQCCLLETLRLYPSAPVRSRMLCEDDTFAAADPAGCPLLWAPGAVCLRKGTHVGFAINALHRDPEHWPQPDSFDPTRFRGHTSMPSAVPAAPRPADGAQPLTYIPFGAGPRRCIGERLALLEAQEICGAVLRRYTVTCPAGPGPADELRLTLRARGGLRLHLRRDPDA